MNFDKKHINDQIDRYLGGELSPAETDQLWAHLLEDEDAMNYMETVASLKRMASQGAFEEQAEEEEATVTPLFASVYRKTSVWLSAAAILLAAIAGISYFTQQQQSITQVPGPAGMIEFEIYRSGEAPTEHPASVQDIMTASALGEHERAISLYDNHVSETEADPELKFLEASLYYNAGEFRDAIEMFKQLADEVNETDTYTAERSVWYAANAHLHLGEKDAAESLLHKVIEFDGSYSRIAQRMLSGLEKKN